MNEPLTKKTKRHIITSLNNYANDIESARAGDFVPALAKSTLLHEIAYAIDWIRQQEAMEDKHEKEQEEGFIV